MMVSVVPLAPLPAHRAMFDYAWSPPQSREPHRGELVKITLRGASCAGIIIEINSQPTHAYKKIQPAVPFFNLPLVNSESIAFAQESARAHATALSEILRRMIPPVGVKTVRDFSPIPTELSAHHSVTEARVQYEWYVSPETYTQQLTDRLTHTASLRHALVAPTHEAARQIKHDDIALYTPDHARQRRMIWSTWQQQKPITLAGTHLTVWLPLARDQIFTVLDPTHPAHEQWDGPPFHNVDVLNIRQHHTTEEHVYLAHTPHVSHHKFYSVAPAMMIWPSLYDIADMKMGSRTAELARICAHHAQTEKKVCVLVSHQHRALYVRCDECSALTNTVGATQLPVCGTCASPHVYPLSAGGSALKHDLISNHNFSSDQITLADIRNQQRAQITILTAAAADYTDLSSFATIIDAASDAAIRDARYDAEERAIGRLRRIASSLGSEWHGTWIAYTAHPQRPLWNTRTGSGLVAWWLTESHLRAAFHQPPFHDTVSKSDYE